MHHDVAPLNDVMTISNWLSEINGQRLEDVERRLLAECHFIGHNVCEAAKKFGLVPHVWDEQLLKFYNSTDAFLFETVAWNSTPMKKEMREVVCQGLKKRLQSDSKILCFGDGMGFDSAALARCGFNVTCYEVSGPCLEFARRQFELNRLNVCIETCEKNLEAGKFDAVVCLDVLEHVPSPVETVRQFSHWLNDAGILVAHAPFYHVDWTRPTHLSSNRRFSGSIKELYGAAGFQAVESGGPLLNPLFLQKSTVPVSLSLRTRARLRLARAIVKGARFSGPVPRLVAAAICKAPVAWRLALENSLNNKSA